MLIILLVKKDFLQANYVFNMKKFLADFKFSWTQVILIW